MANTRLEKGEYYRRIARPYRTAPVGHDKSYDGPGRNPEDEERAQRLTRTKILAESAGQLHHLKEHLEQICKVVYPCNRNYNAYGHEIRSVFIVACTEVEAQWYSILKAHGYNFKRGSDGEDRGTTNDYVELLDPLKLDQYSVKFPYFPDMKIIKPFKSWSKNGSTKSLDWYAAYNRSKHNREKHFRDATLNYAFKAAAAYFVMLCAQHGWELIAPDKEAATKFFHLIDKPSWDESDCYEAKKRKDDRAVFDKCKNLLTGERKKRKPLIIERNHVNLIPGISVP
jgi:hypothetical protein